MLLHVIGKEAQEVYKTLVFEDDEKDNYEVLVKKLGETFLPKTNVSYERYRFNTTVQKVGQSYDSYFTELRALSKNCNFEQLKDSLIRDRVICGICDLKLQALDHMELW